MSLKLLLSVLIAFGLILNGCGKKKDAENIEKITMETLEAETKVVENDTSDIFDEFYEDADKPSESEAAAKTTEVSSDAEPVATQPVTRPPQFNPDGRYVVQVSCVASRTMAQRIVSQLEQRGYPAYIAEVQNPTSELIGMYHRIRIGGFSYVSHAKEFARNYLVPEGYDFWVDNKSNDNVGMDGYGLGTSPQREYQYSNTDQNTTPASANNSGTASVSPSPAVKAPVELMKPEDETIPAAVPVSQNSQGTVSRSKPSQQTTSTPSTTPTATPAATATSDEWGVEVDDWGVEDTSEW